MVAVDIVWAIVRIAINFDREGDRRTEEIDYRFRLYHHMLPTKLQAAQLSVGQRSPQPLLGFRGVSAHHIRALQKFGFRGTALPHPNPSPEGEGLRNYQFHTMPTSLNGLGSRGGMVESLRRTCQKPTSIQRPAL